MAQWIKVNGEGIYGSRPWKVFGEGPTPVPRGRAADQPLPYTPNDFRFTTKDGKLYVFVMALPAETLAVKSLGLGVGLAPPIAAVALVGSDELVRWRQDEDAVRIEKPARVPSADVISFKVTFK